MHMKYQQFGKLALPYQKLQNDVFHNSIDFSLVTKMKKTKNRRHAYNIVLTHIIESNYEIHAFYRRSDKRIHSISLSIYDITCIKTRVG